MIASTTSWLPPAASRRCRGRMRPRISLLLVDRDLLFLDQAVEARADGGHPALDEVFLDVDQLDGVPRLREHLGDAVTHGTGADHRYASRSWAWSAPVHVQRDRSSRRRCRRPGRATPARSCRAALAQRVEQRHEHARARCADRVPERHGAAVDVEPLGVES